jgi:ferric-dicitrate binding protein FerR (iron transport regulator)
MVLCSLLVSLPAIPQSQSGNQVAGQINALVPAATRNSQIAKVKQELDWNDLLKTESSGRIRAGLKDGSILSVGSNSELRVVQHDNASQQTSLELDFGKVRSQVVKITKSGGKFETKTPNAVIGVIGTDYFVGYEANRTTVICYQGQVSVTPIGDAHATNNTGKSDSNSNSITVSAGQMVVITSEIPPTGFQPSNAPPDVVQASLSSTDVKGEGAPAHGGHLFHVVLIGAIVGIGVGVGLYGSNQSGSRCKPGSPNCG